MTEKTATSEWLESALETVRAGGFSTALLPIAEKLVDEPALSPLWRKMQKTYHGDETWSSGENVFRHLALFIDNALKPLTGYAAMSPAQLDAWRKKTQDRAMGLLGDLMEGYPQIIDQEDDALLGDRWVYGAALYIATNGEADDFDQLIPLVRAEKFDGKHFGQALNAVGRLPMILTRLIQWLDFEAARRHSVTHSASKNAHRSSFIRRITHFFELHLDSPMRSHVYAITALFFDMGGLDVADIKKIAPAMRGGKNPRSFLENSPG